MTFKTDVLDMGNQLGNDEAVYLWTLQSQMEVKLTSGAIIWEMNHNGTRYKLEVTPDRA